MSALEASGLTPTGRRLVLAITSLSIAHHIDHVARGVTGWPLDGDFNPFSASLFVYPVIAAGVILSNRRRVGAKFWSALAGGAALFIAFVHVGPAAGDAVGSIPKQYDSTVSDALALATLGGLFGLLVVHCIYEVRRGRSN